jgi:hypothetical protein
MEQSEKISLVDINGYTYKRLFNIIDKILFLFRIILSKVRIIDKSKCQKYKWRKVSISFNDAHFRYKTKIYEVYLTEDNPRFKYVIKPSKKICSYEFERLFDFGQECNGYDENRMVGLYIK